MQTFGAGAFSPSEGIAASAKDFLAAEYRNHWHDDCGMAGGREGLHVLFPDAWPRNAMLSSTPTKRLG